MALVLADVKTELNGLLDDSANSTWSDTDKENYLDSAVKFLSRGERPAVWQQTDDTSITTTDGTLEYTMPSGMFLITELWLEKENSSNPVRYELIREFRQWNGKFRLAEWKVPRTTGLTFRIKGISKITSITDLDDEAEDAILDYAQYRAYMALSNRVSDYNKYSAKLQGISRNDVKLVAREHLQEAREKREELRRPLPVVYMGKGEY